MARNGKLNDKQKDRVVELVQAGKSRKDVATFFNVSPRTIYRVLYEKGLQPSVNEASEPRVVTATLEPAQARLHLTHLSDDEQAILRICKAAGLDADALRRTLTTPALTPENIRTTLTNLASDQLGMFLDAIYTSRALSSLSKATQPVQQEMPA